MKLRLLASSALLAFLATACLADTFTQTNLVSDGSVSAAVTDSQLINPWGVATSATSPFWVADHGTGLSTLYNSAGAKQGLVVSIIAPANTSSSPTGVAFNPNTANFDGHLFLFASENGSIEGWKSANGTNAIIVVDNSGIGAKYTGLAIAGDKLFAANFANNSIDVFDANFSSTSLLGNFTDPNLPAGFAPYNIQYINGKLYVTFAKTSGGNPAGDGIVDVFDTNGSLLGRVISPGVLNNPWGLALAPSTFGSIGSSLLVANFGDGTIDAFDATTGTFLETLSDSSNAPIINQGLHGLIFGNGGNGGDPNTLYFTAGFDGTRGLLGSLTPTSSTPPPVVPEPASFLLMATGVGAMLRRRFSR